MPADRSINIKPIIMHETTSQSLPHHFPNKPCLKKASDLDPAPGGSIHECVSTSA